MRRLRFVPLFAVDFQERLISRLVLTRNLSAKYPYDATRKDAVLMQEKKYMALRAQINTTIYQLFLVLLLVLKTILPLIASYLDRHYVEDSIETDMPTCWSRWFLLSFFFFFFFFFFAASVELIARSIADNLRLFFSTLAYLPINSCFENSDGASQFRLVEEI